MCFFILVKTHYSIKINSFFLLYYIFPLSKRNLFFFIYFSVHGKNSYELNTQKKLYLVWTTKTPPPQRTSRERTEPSLDNTTNHFERFGLNQQATQQTPKSNEQLVQ